MSGYTSRVVGLSGQGIFSDKKTAIIFVAALFILGLAAGLELLEDPPAGQAPAAGTLFTRVRVPTGDRVLSVKSDVVLRYEDLLRLLAPAAQTPAGRRFAEEFMKRKELKTAWEDYRQNQDLDLLTYKLRRVPLFGEMMRRYASDPAFRKAVEGLANIPELASRIRALGDATDSSLPRFNAKGLTASPGRRRAVPVQTSARASDQPLTGSPGRRKVETQARMNRAEDSGNLTGTLAPIPEVVGAPVEQSPGVHASAADPRVRTNRTLDKREVPPAPAAPPVQPAENATPYQPTVERQPTYRLKSEASH
jgi:hypothetical protein